MFGAAAGYGHFVFESLAYIVGFALYRHYRRRFGDFLPSTDRSSVIVAASGMAFAVVPRSSTNSHSPKLTIEQLDIWSRTR